MEYTFRGKANVTGEWVYGDLMHHSHWKDGSYWIRYFDEEHQCFVSVKVDPETVGQYTGVKERYPQMVGEGQEIYLGDIVRLFEGEYCQGYYEYDQTIIVTSAYDIVAMEESENVQLLGNVWDNPELLKEGGV
jgi:hypothetical protein